VRRSAASVAVVLLAVLALGGCGTSEGDQPVVIPPVTSEPTSSGAPSAAAPPHASSPRGSATGKPSDAELIAVVINYFEAAERAFQTMDTRELEPYGMPSCLGCARRLASIRSLRSKGHHLVGGRFDYTERVVLGGGTATRQSVRLGLRLSGAEIQDSSGQLVERVPAESGLQQIDLVLDGDRWRIAKILGLQE
jgi:hypothetical protein